MNGPSVQSNAGPTFVSQDMPLIFRCRYEITDMTRVTMELEPEQLCCKFKSSV